MESPSGDCGLRTSLIRSRSNSRPACPRITPKERFAAHAKGTLTNGFDEGRFGLKLTVEGCDMAQFYPLTGLVLPKTPPYSLTGMLGHKGDAWRFDDFQGRMGDSDLAGDLAIRTAAAAECISALI